MVKDLGTHPSQESLTVTDPHHNIGSSPLFRTHSFSLVTGGVSERGEKKKKERDVGIFEFREQRRKVLVEENGCQR